MKYYYLLVFVFFFAKVFAQNNEDSDANSYATGTDTADSEEALYKKVETLRQFCEFAINETDEDVKNFNLQICQAFAQVNAGDIDGAKQTIFAMFADKSVSPEKKHEILQKNEEIMKEIEESIHASYNNDASNSNSASNSNNGQN